MSTLTQYLEAHAAAGSRQRDVAALIERLAEAAGSLQRLISTGATGDAGAATGPAGDPNGGGDIQKVLDREADRCSSMPRAPRPSPSTARRSRTRRWS